MKTDKYVYITVFLMYNKHNSIKIRHLSTRHLSFKAVTNSNNPVLSRYGRDEQTPKAVGFDRSFSRVLYHAGPSSCT